MSIWFRARGLLDATTLIRVDKIIAVGPLDEGLISSENPMIGKMVKFRTVYLEGPVQIQVIPEDADRIEKILLQDPDAETNVWYELRPFNRPAMRIRIDQFAAVEPPNPNDINSPSCWRAIMISGNGYWITEDEARRLKDALFARDP